MPIAKSKYYTLFILVIIISLALCYNVIYAAPTINKIVMSPTKTEYLVGSDAVALTVKASGSRLTYKWMLQGVGSLQEPTTNPAIFYHPPESIDKEATQVMISVIVTDDEGQEASDSVVFTVRTDGTSPVKSTPKPTPSRDTSSGYKPTPDDFTEDFWTPTDCSYIKENGNLVEFYRVDAYEENVWRTWDTVRAASQYTNYEGIIYAFKEGFRDVQRFKVKTGTPLYRARLGEDTEIEFGPCWKEIKEFPGHTFISGGVRKQVLKQILYVLDTK